MATKNRQNRPTTHVVSGMSDAADDDPKARFSVSAWLVRVPRRGRPCSPRDSKKAAADPLGFDGLMPFAPTLDPTRALPLPDTSQENRRMGRGRPPRRDVSRRGRGGGGTGLLVADVRYVLLPCDCYAVEGIAGTR